MTEHSRPNLKAKFESGDKPDGGDFGDLIDSFLNVQDGAVQVFSGPIGGPLLATNLVSADDVYVDNVVFTNAAIEEFSLDAVSADGITASSVAALATITAPSVSAQLVNGIALHHRNPHALVFATDQNSFSIAASGYTRISALLSAAPNGFVGFSQNGSTTVTYTGSTTAKMHLHYDVAVSYNTAVATLGSTVIFKNGTIDPGSRCTATLSTIDQVRAFTGDTIIQMVPSDSVDIRVLVTSTNVVGVNITSYNLSINPVSWDL